ncbi:universal stress protein [Spirillospora sp. NPDC050679]
MGEQGDAGRGTGRRPLPGVEEVPVESMSPETWRRRVVVGVDGSFGAEHALRWAAKQARQAEAALDVVSVWEDLSPGAGPSLHDDPLRVAAERLDRALETLVRDRDLPVRIITAPLHGPPAQRLVERAKDALLLVLGTTGISSPEIPGGVGLYCVRHSTTPVVFVPPPAA